MDLIPPTLLYQLRTGTISGTQNIGNVDFVEVLLTHSLSDVIGKPHHASLNYRSDQLLNITITQRLVHVPLP